MSKIDTMINFAVNIANNNKHGYSQYHRWGPDYDCSSLVITAAEKAGFPVKAYGATYTGNMKRAFLKAGFKDVTHTVNLRTGAGLQRGDVLLNEKYHTELYIGNGKLVGANSDEWGGIAGYNRGDQTGREIYVKNYYVYRKGWNCVLRPQGSKVNTSIKSGVKFIKNERWRGITREYCNVRSYPSTSAPIVATYSPGQPIYYDSVYEANGYRWISYIGNDSGLRRYVAYRTLNGKAWIKF